MNELFGAETLDPDLDSDEVIYRYDPVEDPIELEVVDLRAWFAATGPEDLGPAAGPTGAVAAPRQLVLG